MHRRGPSGGTPIMSGAGHRRGVSGARSIPSDSSLSHRSFMPEFAPEFKPNYIDPTLHADVSEPSRRSRRASIAALAGKLIQGNNHATDSMKWLPKRNVVDQFSQIPGIMRRRSLPEMIYLLLEDATSCKLAIFILCIIMILIIVSCGAYVFETMPATMQYTQSCRRCGPVYDTGNATELLEREALEAECQGCEPEVHEIFMNIEVFAVIVFTVEYGLRFLTAWSVPTASEINLPPEELTPEVTAKLYHPTLRMIVRRTIAFMFNAMNLVDLLAIFPFYVALLYDSDGATFTFIRLLRLFRVIRLTKLQKMTGNMFEFSENLLMFVHVIKRARKALIISFCYTLFVMILWASCIYTAEKGIWDPKTGRYFKESTYYLDQKEESLFISIPMTFWWVLVTFTTVGYGDMYPTTTPGRMIGVMVMYCGVLLFAMPITIIGGEFRTLYEGMMNVRAANHEKFRNAAHIIAMPFIEKELGKTKIAFQKWRYFVQLEQEEEADPRNILRKTLREAGLLQLGALIRSYKKQVKQEKGTTKDAKAAEVIGVSSIVGPGTTELLRELIDEVRTMNTRLSRLEKTVEDNKRLPAIRGEGSSNNDSNVSIAYS